MPERESKMDASAISLLGCTTIGFLTIPFFAVIAVAGLAFLLFWRRLILPPELRVNGLANLEALLTNWENCAELSALVLGVVVILHGFMAKNARLCVIGKEFELGRGRRCAVGAGLILCALCPHTSRYILNFLVASARDAGLF